MLSFAQLPTFCMKIDRSSRGRSAVSITTYPAPTGSSLRICCASSARDAMNIATAFTFGSDVSVAPSRLGEMPYLWNGNVM